MSTTTTPSRKLSPWVVPFAMAAGTTAVIIAPLFWIRRQRGHALRRALSADTPTPTPTTAASALRFARGTVQPVITDTAAPTRAEPPPTPPGLFTALSHADVSSALYASKALGIATILVAFAGLGLVASVKALTGLTDVRNRFFLPPPIWRASRDGLQMNQFAHEARKAVQTYMPSLSKAIYRIPDTPSEPVDPALQDIASQLDNELIDEIKRLNT